MNAPYDCASAIATVNVSVVTTAETVAVSSGPAKCPFRNVHVVIFAWCQLTTGTSTTAVTARIRRGTAADGTLVGEGNPITIGAAAGSNEAFSILVEEDRADENSVEYSLTIEQTGADGNGTILQSAIMVMTY